MKNFRSALILGIVAALLAATLLLDRRNPGTAERDRENTVLFSVDPEKIEKLRITDAQGTCALERRDAAWRIVEPIETAADAGAVDGILRGLQSVVTRRVIPFSEVPRGAETLRQWGLDPGNSRIEFSGPDFADTLIIGRKTAVNELVYARALRGAGRTAEAPVYLISESSGVALDRKLADLRSHAVLAVGPAPVERFGLRVFAAAAPVEYEVAREGTAWKLQKPLAAPADARRVAAWLQRLGALQVKQFIADDAANLSTYGLSSPASQLTLTPAGAKPETLLIGLPVPGAAGEVYAKRPDNAVVTLDAAAVDRLLRDLPEVRDRRVLPFIPALATGLRIEIDPAKPGGKPTLVTVDQKDGNWTFAAPDTGLADGPKVVAFLQALSTLEAAEIVSDTATDLHPYGLDHPIGRLTVTLANAGKDQDKDKDKEKGEGGTIALLFGRADKGRFYVKDSRTATVSLVDPSFLDQAPREAWVWLGPKVVDLKPEQVASVAVALDGAPPFTLTRQGAGTVTDRAGATVDPAKAAALWDAVAHLRAARWLGAPQPAYGLAKPRGKVRVGGNSSPLPFTLLIGSPLPAGGRSAQVEGQPAAFVLSDTDLAALAAPPFAPGAPAAKP
jgi:hypothetical protein